MNHPITDLRDDRAKLCTIFDAIGDGVAVCDVSGRIVDINNAACDLFAAPRSAATGRPIADFTADPAAEATVEAAFAWLADAAPGAAAAKFEWRCRTGDGSHAFDAEITLRPIAFDGRPFGLAVIRDISEHKALVASLVDGTRRDPLTGLPDRRDFADMLPYEIARYERYGGYLCVVLGRLDEFDHGDPRRTAAVVKNVAGFVRGRLRRSDYVARAGDEEIGLLIHDTRPDVTARMLSRLRTALQHHEVPELTHPIGISFGLTGYHLGDTPEGMLTRLREAVDLASVANGHHRVVTA